MVKGLELDDALKTELAHVGSVESILQDLKRTVGVTIDRSRVAAILHPRGLPAFAELGIVFTLRDLHRLLQPLQAALATVKARHIHGLDASLVPDLERGIAEVQAVLAQLHADHPDLRLDHVPDEHETPVGALQRVAYVRERSMALYDHLASTIPSAMPQRQPQTRRGVRVKFNSHALRYTARLVNAEFWPAVTLTAATLKSGLQHRSRSTRKSI